MADWGVPALNPDMQHFDELMRGIQAQRPPTTMTPSRQSENVDQRPDLSRAMQMQHELPLWFGPQDWSVRVMQQPKKPYLGQR